MPLGASWWFVPKPLSEYEPVCENDQHGALLDEVARLTERAEKAEAEAAYLREKLRTGTVGGDVIARLINDRDRATPGWADR